MIGARLLHLGALAVALVLLGRTLEGLTADADARADAASPTLEVPRFPASAYAFGAAPAAASDASDASDASGAPAPTAAPGSARAPGPHPA